MLPFYPITARIPKVSYRTHNHQLSMGCCASDRAKLNQASVNATQNPQPQSQPQLNQIPSQTGSQIPPQNSHSDPVAVNAHPPQGQGSRLQAAGYSEHPPNSQVQHSNIPAIHISQARENPVGGHSNIQPNHYYSAIPGRDSTISYHNKSAVHEQSGVPSHIHNENGRLVELDNVKELMSAHEKVHGEEQTLQTYHPSFEIPIFQVALTAHS